MLTVWWLKFYNKKSYGSRQVKTKSVSHKPTALLIQVLLTMHSNETNNSKSNVYFCYINIVYYLKPLLFYTIRSIIYTYHYNV